jgi:hypothetical protein
MKIYKTICPDTAENEYRVEIAIDVLVTLPDYSNDASDIDYYGCVELRDFEIISVQKRIGVENPTEPRQKRDRVKYSWWEVQMEDITPEEREELMQEINKEVNKYVNC